MNRAFWQRKRVFLTGHTGFKGSWLALWLQRLGADVVGYALAPPERPNLFEDAEVAGGMRSILGDIRDADALAGAVAAAEPEVVIHLAAQALVRGGYEDPIGTFTTNVTGTAHLLESLRGLESPRAVLSVTSDKCYRNESWVWGYRENDPLGGRDPYSASKACAELVTAAYRDAFFARDEARGIAVASARSGNVIGGGDWAADRLLPDLVRGFRAGSPVAIRQPEATRPWQHVLEPLRGYLELAERLASDGGTWAEAWNFGPGEEDNRTVRWVADRTVELWGGGASWRHDRAAHPPEAGLLMLDCSKTRRRLGWRPRLELERGLEWTVAWYKAWERGDDLAAATRDQIGAYEELVASA